MMIYYEYGYYVDILSRFILYDFSKNENLSSSNLVINNMIENKQHATVFSQMSKYEQFKMGFKNNLNSTVNKNKISILNLKNMSNVKGIVRSHNINKIQNKTLATRHKHGLDI